MTRPATTVTTTNSPAPRLGLRRAARDGWTMTGRAFAHWARQPGLLAAGLAFPILLVLMFGYLLGGGMALPGGGSYREFLMPGMLAMAMLFGLEATVLAVSTDNAKGITDRFRSMPMSPSAVVVGRGVADLIYSMLSLAVLVGTGLAVGWTWHEGLGNALVAAALLLWLRFAFIWVGIVIGLSIKGPESAVAVQVLVWPIGFLSSAYVSPATMPDWLAAIAEWNPVSATVTAARDLFGNPDWPNDSWASAHALELAVAWPLVLTAVFLPLAITRYRGLGR